MTAARLGFAALALALAAAVATGAAAQQPAVERAQPDSGRDTSRAPFNDQPVDELIGESVTASNGTPIGYIKDLLTDGQGKFFTVIAIGSYLGLGERNIVIPAEKLTYGMQRVTLAASVSQEEFEAMPDFVSGQYRSIVPRKQQSGASRR